MHKLVLRRLAELDLVDAAAWYDLQQPGVGDIFLDQFRRDADTIAEAPQRWPLYHGKARRYVMARFPYIIFYTVEEDVVRIVQVVHGKRDPEAIKRRLL